MATDKKRVRSTPRKSSMSMPPAEAAARVGVTPAAFVLPTTGRAEERAMAYEQQQRHLLEAHAKHYAGRPAKELLVFLQALATTAFVAGHDAAVGRDPDSVRERIQRAAKRAKALKSAAASRQQVIRDAFAATGKSLTKEERVAAVVQKLNVSRATVFRALQDA